MSDSPPSACRDNPDDSDDSHDHVVDARGRRCPLPILDLARAMPSVTVGSVVTVIADDPAARFDVPAWCRMRHHDYLGLTELPDGSLAQRVRRAH